MTTINPLLWNGPAFLGFYAAFSVIVVAGHRVWLRMRNRPAADASAMKAILADPYAVAFLRDGPTETLRTAVFALVNRGALEVSGKNLSQVEGADLSGLKPLEKEVFARFDRPRSAESLIWGSSWGVQATEHYDTRLREAGLLDRTGERERRVYWLLVKLLLGVAGIKVVYALATGHGNVGFLIALALLAWIVLKPMDRRLTPLGKRLLEQQQVLFQGLQRGKKATAAAGDDATWAAAVFGVGVMSVAAFPAVAHLMPARTPGAGYGSGDAGSSSSSSCSSSSDSGGGGSSCGSGGGCGGCGGGGGD